MLQDLHTGLRLTQLTHDVGTQTNPAHIQLLDTFDVIAVDDWSGTLFEYELASVRNIYRVVRAHQPDRSDFSSRRNDYAAVHSARRPSDDRTIFAT